MVQEHVLIPQPPFDSVLDPTVQLWVTGFMAAMAAIALVYALIHWRSSGKPTFLLLFLGGGAMMLFEPMVDTVGACWFPGGDSWIAFHAYGRPMPVWLCLTYFFYFGIGVGATWQLMRKGLSRNQLWALFLGGIVGDFIMEATLLHFNTWTYYGWQPLVVLKFPFWWGPVNSLIIMVCGALVCRYEKKLTQDWRQWQIIPIALTTSAACNAMAGWPSWLVINTDVGPLLTQLGGIASFALAFWFMRMVVDLIAAPVAVPATADTHAFEHAGGRRNASLRA